MKKGLASLMSTMATPPAGALPATLPSYSREVELAQYVTLPADFVPKNDRAPADKSPAP